MSAAADSSSFSQRAVSRSMADRISPDLRQLILQRGRFAQQPQHVLTPGFERPAALLQRLLQLLATRAFLAASRLRADCGLGFQFRHAAQMRLQLLAQLACRFSSSCVSVSPCVSRCSMAPIC